MEQWLVQHPHKVKVVGSNPTPARNTVDKPPRGVFWVMLIIYKENKVMGYVYKITNDINGKVYIGKTQNNVEKRFSEHLRASRKPNSEKRPLYSAIRKYGENHFLVETLEICCDDILSTREKYWIEYYNSFKLGYNATVGGDGVQYINRNSVVELYQKYKNCRDVANIMGIHPDSVYDILRQNGIHIQWGGYSTSCKVAMLDKLTNKEVYVFNSYADAARWLICNGKSNCQENGLRSHIADACKDKRKTVAGYKWKSISIT